MKKVYQTQGTCSKLIEFDVEDGIVNDVVFYGGCNGNLQGIARLVKGMKVDEVISRLEGINCGGKGTSCPDQLAKALREQIEGI
ncbi:MAG: TIGR03905 family TSCPD domain-containing protein [Bacteroidaceae bacterium]|nr:TIGR03905 family TSCPD domain-containing protein [Bacteroidaceae bacterium]